MSKTGWIKIHRKSVDNPLYFAEPFDKWHAWEDLIMMATRKEIDVEFNGHTFHLKPGQLVTSTGLLARRWKWSVNKVRRFLEQLAQTDGTSDGIGMCRTDGTSNGTTLTIVNWAKYQVRGRSDGISDGISERRTAGTSDGIRKQEDKEDKEIKGGSNYIYINNKRPATRPALTPSEEIDEWARQLIAEGKV